MYLSVNGKRHYGSTPAECLDTFLGYADLYGSAKDCIVRDIIYSRASVLMADADETEDINLMAFDDWRLNNSTKASLYNIHFGD